MEKIQKNKAKNKNSKSSNRKNISREKNVVTPNFSKTNVNKNKNHHSTKLNKIENLNVGHRERARHNVIQSPESRQDYELLEVLLFGSHPRKDTKGLAKQILDEFGTLQVAIHTDPCVLKNIYHFSDPVIAILVALKELCCRSAKTEISKKRLLNQTEIVSNYIKSRIGFSEKELMIALFLDKGYRLIRDEVVGRGTTDHISIYPKEIASLSLVLNASYVILAHNHPSGNTSPSEDDFVMTKKIIESLKTLNIKVLDHIIVTKSNNLSFRTNLIINSKGEFNEDFDFDSLKDSGDINESDLTEEEKESFDKVKNLYDSILLNSDIQKKSCKKPRK